MIMFRLNYFKKWFFLRSELDRMLTLSMLFSFLLVAAAMVYTTYFVYFFLIWNLFLAYIPYFISNWIIQRPAWMENNKKLVMVLFTWIAFLPNTFYILTDIFHLGETHWLPRWYDLIVLVSFAFNGALLGFVSIRQMEKIIELKLGSRAEWLFTIPIIFLNGLGVYIGRYMRYNSWDFITNPLQLFADILNLLIHPFSNLYAWGMIVSFSVLLGLVYMIIKRLGRIFGSYNHQYFN